MQFLVSAKWIEGEAKERGLSATDAEVKRQFEQTKDQSLPERQGLPALPEDVRPDRGGPPLPRPGSTCSRTRSASRSPRRAQNVSDGEIEDYYNENEQQFSQPERRDLEVILTKSQAKALEAKKAVDGGQKWSAAAKKFSVDPASKEQGGKLLGVSKGQQDPKFDAAIFAAVQGRVAGPVKTDAGYYVFRVTKVTKATKQGLEQSKQGIKQLLVSQKQQKELDSFSTNFRNTWRKRTDCAEDFVIADCRNGREPTQAATPAVPPGQPKPVPGRLRRQPARPGRHGHQSCRRQRRGHRDRQRARGEPAQRQASADSPAPSRARRHRLRSAALPRRAQRPASPAACPAAVPGATPGAGGQQVPPQGQQAPPPQGGD